MLPVPGTGAPSPPQYAPRPPQPGSYRCCAAGRGRRRARPGGRRGPAGAARRAAGPWRGRRRGERVPAAAAPAPPRPRPRPPLTAGSAPRCRPGPVRAGSPLLAGGGRPAPALGALSRRGRRRRGEEERGQHGEGSGLCSRRAGGMRGASDCSPAFGGGVQAQHRARPRHSSSIKAGLVTAYLPALAFRERRWGSEETLDIQKRGVRHANDPRDGHSEDPQCPPFLTRRLRAHRDAQRHPTRNQPHGEPRAQNQELPSPGTTSLRPQACWGCTVGQYSGQAAAGAHFHVLRLHTGNGTQCSVPGGGEQAASRGGSCIEQAHFKLLLALFCPGQNKLPNSQQLVPSESLVPLRLQRIAKTKQKLEQVGHVMTDPEPVVAQGWLCTKGQNLV